MDEYYCRCKFLLDRGMQRCRQREPWADSRDLLNKSAYMKFNHRKARTSKCRQEISKATELHQYPMAARQMGKRKESTD